LITGPSEGCYGTTVVSYSPLLTKLGTAVNPERSISANALGAPDGQTPVANAPVQNFVSLGFGGSIEIQFAGPIANGPGNDVFIWESSAGNNAEMASIEVSQDGLSYTAVGTVGMDGGVDFASAFSNYINFIRITDISNPAQFANVQISDGFDVDAVECLHGPYVAPCVGTGVYSSNQADRKNGSDVIASRSNPLSATGSPDGSFFSLGFGGEIVLSFDAPVANGLGADIRLTEITNGYTCVNYPEEADVFASLNGVDYVYLGSTCQSGDFDLGSLSAAQYIKIIDISDATSAFFPVDADGYDVDAIECLNGPGTPNDDLTPCSAQEVTEFIQGDRKNGTDVVAARSDENKALGLPQGDDTINFVSLGFGGTITVKFDFVVWNNPGADIQVVETSFGNPTCGQYPEKAKVEASLDLLSWEDLGQLCLDGTVDLGPLPYALYFRITDESNPASFSGSADGFDVDAVVCYQSDAKLADNTTTPDEASSVEMGIFPNPADEYTTISLDGATADQKWTVEVVDAAGRIVSSQNFVSTGARTSTILNTNTLAKGIYQVVLTSANERLVSRLAK